MREALLGVSLFASAGMVVRGVALWSEPAAWIVAGLLTALVAAVFLAEVGDA